MCLLGKISQSCDRQLVPGSAAFYTLTDANWTNSPVETCRYSSSGLKAYLPCSESYTRRKDNLGPIAGGCLR